MTQICMIPLTQCDFESALKVADHHRKESTVPTENDNTLPSKPVSPSTVSTDCEPKLQTHTSGRTRMVINYKKFLEDYVDEPRSPPPKKQHEVDLKCQPSKQ